MTPKQFFFFENLSLIFPVHLSIFLSICLGRIFLRIYSVDFLNFLHEYILPYILKSNKVIFWKIERCLDNWVDETNLDQKRNMWHFNEGNIAFCAVNDAL